MYVNAKWLLVVNWHHLTWNKRKHYKFRHNQIIYSIFIVGVVLQ